MARITITSPGLGTVQLEDDARTSADLIEEAVGLLERLQGLQIAHQPYRLTVSSRTQLMERLLHLLPAQLERLIATLEIPTEVLRDQTMTHKVIDVLQYMEWSGRMEEIGALLTEWGG